MKLMEFAIHRKLEADDKLLDYVAKNKAVPCSVLEDGLESIIGPLVDTRASMLLSDYPQMLQTYTPVTYQKGEGDTYHIHGSIPDTTLESIKLVHNVDANDAIAAMIAANEETLQQHSTITNIDLLASAQRLLAAPMPTIRQEAPVHQEPIQQVYQEPVREPIQQVYQAPIAAGMNAADVASFAASKSMDSVPYEPMYAPINEVSSDVSEQQLQTQMMEVEKNQQEARAMLSQTAMDIDNLDNVPTLEQAQSERITAPDETPKMIDALRKIYRDMIHDIKELGLDKSLGLNL